MASAPSGRLWVEMLLLLMVVVVVVFELPSTQQKCIFDEVQAQVRVVRNPPEEPKVKVRKRSVVGEEPHSQPIRIQTWFMRESDGISDTAVEEAVKVVSSLLSVKKVLGCLRLKRDINKYCKFIWKNSSMINHNRCGRANKNYRSETCLDVAIPDDHLEGCDIYPEPDSPQRTVLRPEGSGLTDADFLLYVLVEATDKCRAEPGVLAYAAHCQTDGDGRPLAAVMVICRQRHTRDTSSQRARVQTVIHELFHVLGFSKDLFNTWRDCITSPQGVTGCSSRGKVTHSDGSGQMRIYTPSIISAMQKHLTSADPDLGGPLENLGVSPGFASSHWESRALQGSIMAAALGDPTTVRIDSVTLAAFEDMGWYKVNLSRAQSLVWGEGEGATFGSLSMCRANTSSFFCTGSGRGCHFLHLHKGECQTDEYLEGCRVYKPLKNGSECFNKENTRSTGDELNGEIFGFDSRCFLSSLDRKGHVEGRCYRHRCTGLNRYQIQVSGSKWVDCPAGSSIQVKGYQGLVFCPDRRLCLFHDVVPPSDDLYTFNSGNSETSTPNRTWLIVKAPAMAASICLIAGICFVVAFISHLKCKIRFHTVVPQELNI